MKRVFNKRLLRCAKDTRYIVESLGSERHLNVDLTTTHTINGGAALKLYSAGDYLDATRDDLVRRIVLH